MPIEVAQSDGYWKSLPVTERAIVKYQQLESMWEKIRNTERELAVLLLDPKIDLAAYYQATRGGEHG